jgi:hypothetical protein
VAEILVALQVEMVAVLPLKLTYPGDVPKFAPVIVTGVPTGPDAGVRFVMLGEFEVTVKYATLLGTPQTLTTTLPVVAPTGTKTWMLVGPQLVAGAAVVPLNFTVLEPWLAPKLDPVMVTGVPTGPLVGLKLVVTGAETTAKETLLLVSPPVWTTTIPEVAPPGTVTTMRVGVQTVGVHAVPLRVTELDPCVPKFAP